MIRFQCPHCQGIVATDDWEPGDITICAYCSEEVNMPEDRLSPGTVLGDFLLVRRLGAGGMGVVYLAHQLSLDRPAAIKILNPEFSTEKDSVQAFVREARSAAKINHPNIVQAYAVGEEEGIFYFAMEFLDGNTMKEVLQEEGRIEPRRAAEIIMQVAMALDCAWKEQKLIHRDIKPDNIMMCANDRVKLADLGLSGTFGDDADDDSDEVVGTPQYISPEQLTGVVTDTRSDIYSLGATFYHLVTGQFPYNGENTEEIAKQHVYGTLKAPREINSLLPQELNDIIVKMMAKTPAARFQNCSELVKTLDDFLHNRGAKSGDSSLKLQAQAPAKTVTLGQSGGGPINIQPKLQPSSIKIGIKGVNDKPKEEESKKEGQVDKKTEESTVAAAVPTAAPVVAPAAGSAPKITLRKAASTPAAAAPATPTPATPTPATPTPATPTPAAVPVAATPQEAAAAAKGDLPKVPPAAVGSVKVKPEENAKVESEKAEGKAEDSNAGADKNKDQKKVSTPQVPRKKPILSWVILLLIVLAVFGVLGWFVWLHYTPKKSVESVIARSSRTGIPLAPTPEGFADIKSEEPPEIAVSAPVPAAPVVRTEEVLSPFMREVRALNDLRLKKLAEFVSVFPRKYNTLRPADEKERQVLEDLKKSYIEADESLKINAARTALLKKYIAQLNAFAEKCRIDAYNARIQAAEEKMFKLAESSPAYYDADLQRKMGMLDYAMITAAQSGSERAWNLFLQAVEAAKREPARVAGRNGFKKSADMLAEYAAQLEIVAEQGRAFSELLKSGSLGINKFKEGSVTITIRSVSPKNITLVTLEAEKQPTVDNPNPVQPQPRTVSLDLLDSAKVEVNDKWISIIELRIGRRDQYFYYLAYNGLVNSAALKNIAPNSYWAQNIRPLTKRYFERALFLSDEKTLSALKAKYESWPLFQRVLREWESQQ